MELTIWSFFALTNDPMFSLTEIQYEGLNGSTIPLKQIYINKQALRNLGILFSDRSSLYLEVKEMTQPGSSIPRFEELESFKEKEDL